MPPPATRSWLVTCSPRACLLQPAEVAELGAPWMHLWNAAAKQPRQTPTAMCTGINGRLPQSRLLLTYRWLVKLVPLPCSSSLLCTSSGLLACEPAARPTARRQAGIQVMEVGWGHCTMQIGALSMDVDETSAGINVGVCWCYAVQRRRLWRGKPPAPPFHPHQHVEQAAPRCARCQTAQGKQVDNRTH